MKKVLMFILVDIIWIVGFVLVLTLSFTPVFLLGKVIYENININVLTVSVPALLFLWLNVYILCVGLLRFIFVPKLKSGVFKILSGQWIRWRLSWILYSYVFLFFNRYMLFNKFIKTPYMKLMGAEVHYTTYFGETADLQDMNNLLSFGRDTLIGSEVTLATHLILSEKHIVFKKLTIGNGVVIGARCSLAPGVTIEDNVILGYNVAVSLSVSIGEGTHIDGYTVIQSNANIGKKCKIGFGCIINAKSVIPDNAVVPDYTVVASGTVYDQDKIKEIKKC
jgi:acetyltransferase-like isoleucine patch superfamily enzyme